MKKVWIIILWIIVVALSLIDWIVPQLNVLSFTEGVLESATILFVTIMMFVSFTIRGGKR